jgi:hypothetical protein
MGTTIAAAAAQQAIATDWIHAEKDLDLIFARAPAGEAI